jgi:hypothetical protein
MTTTTGEMEALSMANAMPFVTLSTAQIGKCGELLVQSRLLKYAIESAPMATDTGIDLVAYAPANRRALTIQVKTNLRPKRSGGKGALSVDWWLPQNSPAELVALVDLESDRVWLLTHEELDRFAQQRPEGRLHFYFYTETAVWPKTTGRHAREFESYRIESRIMEIFGGVASTGLGTAEVAEG